ncbi:MAG TPA: FAD-binding oxidoreductase [Rhodospirillales bacterium]|nr:FAD-binding oxidoreductase [Rhodospirillales bacterium]
MTKCDFLVIGAGMAGASAAFELAGACRVIVLEREEAPGYHSTGRSAAMFLETYGNAIIRDLTVASRLFFADPPVGFSESPLWAPRGTLTIARADQRHTLREAVTQARCHVPAIEEVDGAEARRLNPVLRTDYVAAATFDAEARELDVHAIHGGYLRGLTGRGGEVVTDAEVTALTRNAGAWTAETPVGVFTAPVVVNAAGAWCDEVARLANVAPVGLVAKRRTAITFDGPDGVDVTKWPMVIDVDEEFYFRPEGGRLLASPADATPVPPSDVQPEEFDVAAAVERVEAATELSVRRIAHKWAGLRSFVADDTPVVGMDEEADGFFWLAGQGGYGIMTSPSMARAAAGLITEDTLPADLAERGLEAADLAPGRLR